MGTSSQYYELWLELAVNCLRILLQLPIPPEQNASKHD